MKRLNRKMRNGKIKYVTCPKLSLMKIAKCCRLYTKLVNSVEKSQNQNLINMKKERDPKMRPHFTGLY
jgi:hypothetical protein